ncbi:MAG: LPS export ABC transporter periplasmic protein LptC, partial [Gammaproteobacteria bacterium]|nr:LPS export ABC transporter periplasmic protein LptC [Gammaproteobacteria bacterium]
DFFLHNFSIHQFDSDGSKQQLLQGSHLKHYPDDDSTQVRTAHIKLQTSAQATWIIDARRAHLSRNGEQIVLNDNVVMQRLAFKQLEPLKLETQTLHLDSIENRAKSDQAVQLSSENWLWNAIGMTAELNENKLTLLSQVKGHHALPTP